MKFDHSKFLGKFILSTVTVANFAINSEALSPKNLIENLKSVNTKVVKKPIIKQQKSKVNLSQQNALKKAKSYLKHSGFSRSGLIQQLEYEKFPSDDAIYAVDNCGADWSEQALKKAKSYLKNSAFSAQGLIEQLEYEGFTQEQAEYAIKQIGL